MTYLGCQVPVLRTRCFSDSAIVPRKLVWSSTFRPKDHSQYSSWMDHWTWVAAQIASSVYHGNKLPEISRRRTPLRDKICWDSVVTVSSLATSLSYGMLLTNMRCFALAKLNTTHRKNLVGVGTYRLSVVVYLASVMYSYIDNSRRNWE